MQMSLPANRMEQLTQPVNGRLMKSIQGNWSKLASTQPAKARDYMQKKVLFSCIWNMYWSQLGGQTDEMGSILTGLSSFLACSSKIWKAYLCQLAYSSVCITMLGNSVWGGVREVWEAWGIPFENTVWEVAPALKLQLGSHLKTDMPSEDKVDKRKLQLLLLLWTVFWSGILL